MWVLQLSVHPCHCLCPAKAPAVGRYPTRPHMHPGMLCSHGPPCAVGHWLGISCCCATQRAAVPGHRQDYGCHGLTHGSVQAGPLLLILLHGLSPHLLQILIFLLYLFSGSLIFLSLFVIPWLIFAVTSSLLPKQYRAMGSKGYS